MKPKVLCLTDYYLPGYRGGGPIRTISNLVDALGEDFQFYIVTRDRDLFSNESYPNILIKEWNVVGKASVIYLDSSFSAFLCYARILMKAEFDVVYMNSFFSLRFTILPLLIRYLGLRNFGGVILAPRGEFSPSALSIKPFKKYLFTAFARITGLYKDIFWQASSSFEEADIYKVLNCHLKEMDATITIVSDLIAPVEPIFDLSHKRSKLDGLRIIFLSRVVPIKNLDFLLGLLGRVENPVSLDIYGPLEDISYWKSCQYIINALPSHVSVNYMGEVQHQEVGAVFSRYDAFFFPTKGENFGHVVYESLLVGTPVVVSDQTPWRPNLGAGLTVLSLDSSDAWISIIKNLSTLNKSEFLILRQAAFDYALTYRKTNNANELCKYLFLNAIKK
jgi:glycosyltransferase involved in cell wall biosynthesis